MEVASADECQPLGSRQVSIDSHYGDAGINSFVYNGVQRGLKPNDYQALGLLGNGLLQRSNHGCHVIISRAYILGANAQVLACQLHAQFVVIEVIQRS